MAQTMAMTMMAALDEHDDYTATAPAAGTQRPRPTAPPRLLPPRPPVERKVTPIVGGYVKPKTPLPPSMSGEAPKPKLPPHQLSFPATHVTLNLAPPHGTRDPPRMPRRRRPPPAPPLPRPGVGGAGGLFLPNAGGSRPPRPHHW